MTETIHQFFAACHPFGYPLLACSIVLVAAIIYHLIVTLSNRELRRYSLLIAQACSGDDTADDILKHSCRKSSSALAEEVLYALNKKNRDELPTIMESRLQLFVDSQRAGMTTISVISNIAPMLGILGTAWGLVDIFGVFGTPGAEQGIALGISKALYTTIFGLAIAVPGIIAMACFERRLERRAAIINKLFSTLLANRHKL